MKGELCRYMERNRGVDCGYGLRREEIKAYYGITRGKARDLRKHNGTDCL